MNQYVIIFLVGNAITMLSVGVAAYVKIMAQLKEFEIRIMHVEQRDTQVMKKLEEIDENITKVRIELNNKQNRV